MEIVNVDILDKKGVKGSTQKVNLPIDYQEFLNKDKRQAFHFFLVNTQTRETFSPEDVEMYKQLAQRLMDQKSWSIIGCACFNIFLMRYIYTKNIIWGLTRLSKTNYRLLRGLNKYFFIPQIFGSTISKYFFNEWCENDLDKIRSKYDFNGEPYVSFYKKILEEKTLTMQKV